MTGKRKNKRRRGGQPGNQNARKHGFYTTKLSKKEIEDVLQCLRKGESSPEIAAIQVKMYAALREDPGNTRVVRETARLITRIYRARFGLDRKDAAILKKFISRQLQDTVRQVLENAGTNQKMAERIEAEPEKIAPKCRNESSLKQQHGPSSQLWRRPGQENEKNTFLQNESSSPSS